MRTTVNLDDDIAAAVRQARERRHIGLSQAVNELIRAGLLSRTSARQPFRQQTAPMGRRIDITSVADALEELEGPAFR